MAVGEKKTLKDIHNKMAQKLQYGEIRTIPAKFLGINISRNSNGDIVLDQKQYLEEMEVPDLYQLQGLVKQDVLPEHLQLTFRSLTSKLNMLALSS